VVLKWCMRPWVQPSTAKSQKKCRFHGIKYIHIFV
jgi:hypothetical protein